MGDFGLGLWLGGIIAGCIIALGFVDQNRGRAFGAHFILGFIATLVAVAVGMKFGNVDAAQGKLWPYGVLAYNTVALPIAWNLRRRREAEKARAAKLDRELRADIDSKLSEVLDGYKFQLVSKAPNGEAGGAIGLDAEGLNVRFAQVVKSGATAHLTQNLSLKTAQLQGVELQKHETKFIEQAGTSKADRPLLRAAVGGILFGGPGAIVGAVSSSRTQHSVATERFEYEFSELVIATLDLHHPVIRFATFDHHEAEAWLHRLRATIGRKTLEQAKA